MPGFIFVSSDFINKAVGHRKDSIVRSAIVEASSVVPPPPSNSTFHVLRGASILFILRSSNHRNPFPLQVQPPPTISDLTAVEFPCPPKHIISCSNLFYSDPLPPCPLCITKVPHRHLSSMPPVITVTPPLPLFSSHPELAMEFPLPSRADACLYFLKASPSLRSHCQPKLLLRRCLVVGLAKPSPP